MSTFSTISIGLISTRIAVMAFTCGFSVSAFAATVGVPIHNSTVWKDDRGQEIMCQGGSLCRFGDTFYFYGWGDYLGDNRNDTVTCYSSKDLSNLKFERDVATYGRNNFTIIPDRLHVLYNESTRKYVMITKHRLPYGDPAIPGKPRTAGEIGFADCDTPTGDFVLRSHERPKSSSGEWYAYGDLCAFKDTDGKAYVVSAGTGQSVFYILQLTPDYMHYDKLVCRIPGTHESPYLIKMKDKYWLFASGVAGWGSTRTYYSSASTLAGPWSAYKEVITDPSSDDSFNSQTDFLFKMKGSNGSFMLWGGDRWSQRTGRGKGKNIWLPLQWQGNEPLLKWYPTWNVDAAEGTWAPESDAARPSGQPTSTVPSIPNTKSAAPIMPKIASDWWTVAGNPDIGELTDHKQQPVDFSIWQAADGTWQLWSCIRNTKVGGRTRLFYRWEGKQLTDTDWKPMGIALRADANRGEESVQSPHVIKDGGVYHMFYGDWNHICHATSQDGKAFTRVVGSDGKTGLSGEGVGEFTRDPMVLKIGGTFYCYYCANPEGGKGAGKGVVFCRTSPDLRTWSESKRVAYGGSAGTSWTSAECPFVTIHDGWYYLFRTQSYGQGAQSRVYRSKDPMEFGINDDRFLVGTLPVAAPELIEHEGQAYIASLLPSLKGIRIAQLEWEIIKKPR